MARCLQICRASYQEGEIIMVTQEDLFKSVMDDAVRQSKGYHVRGSSGTGILLGVIAAYLKWIGMSLEDISQTLKDRQG